jgi:hypothetical protein
MEWTQRFFLKRQKKKRKPRQANKKGEKPFILMLEKGIMA